MKKMVLVFLTAMFLTGCTPVLWLQPIVQQQDAAFDQALLGFWEDEDSTLIIRRDGERAYRVTLQDKDDQPQSFRALLFESDGARFLDVTPKDRAPFQVAGHFVVRIWSEGDELRWAFLDSDWFRQQTAAVSRNIGGQTLLDAAAPHKIIQAAGMDDRAYREVARLRRVR